MPRDQLGQAEQPFRFLQVSLGSNKRWLIGRGSSINGVLMRPFNILAD